MALDLPTVAVERYAVEPPKPERACCDSCGRSVPVLWLFGIDGLRLCLECFGPAGEG